MSELITPITDSPIEKITLRRGTTVARMRETQPAVNAPAQDTTPRAGSGDE